MAWIYATQASVAANGTVITVNSGESMAAVMPADAAILGANQAVEVKSAQQVGGTWQLVLERPWPYAAVTNGTLTVQPNGSRFQAAILALRDVNTYAANTHAAMNDWLTSTAASITVETADGSDVSIPTLYSYTQNWGTAANVDRREFDVGINATIQTRAYKSNVGQGGTLKWQLRDPVDDSLVTPSTSGFVYRVRAVTLATSTVTGYMAIVYNLPSVGWKIHVNASASGVPYSNHPYLIIDSDGCPKLTLDHPNSYSVKIFVERINAESTVAHASIAGIDARLLALGDSLRFEMMSGTIVDVLSGMNTVKDTNGFIKAASPVIRLFNDRIEANPEAELQSAQFERVGPGHYTITNTQGLADSGWRIEIPRDEITGELLRFVQCTQAQEEDGTWTITVKTHTPNYSTGALAAGEPMDLDERWIDVRLNSLPEPDAELETAPTE